MNRLGPVALDNLPELSRAAERRFRSRPPDLEFREGADRVQIWDGDDFDPWEGLERDTVRVIRYRQQHPNGEVVEANWLTNLPSRQISRRCLYSMAKSRWQIENEGFRQRPARNPLTQRPAFKQLHRDKVPAFMLIDPVNRANIRVVERGSGSRFPLQTIERLRIVLHLRRQKFEGDVAAKLKVLSLIPHTHAATAQPRQDFVMQDYFTNHWKPYAS